jgi:hypothetical protein
MSSGGKGSRPRPYSVDQKTFDANWDNIFGKQKKIDQEKSEDFEINEEYFDRNDLDDPDRIGN